MDIGSAGVGGLAMTGHLSLLAGRVNLFNRSPERIEPVRDLGGVRVTGEVSGFARIFALSEGLPRGGDSPMSGFLHLADPAA